MVDGTIGEGWSDGSLLGPIYTRSPSDETRRPRQLQQEKWQCQSSRHAPGRGHGTSGRAWPGQSCPPVLGARIALTLAFSLVPRPVVGVTFDIYPQFTSCSIVTLNSYLNISDGPLCLLAAPPPTTAAREILLKSRSTQVSLSSKPRSG